MHCRRARHRLQDLGLNTMTCGPACLSMAVVTEGSSEGEHSLLDTPPQSRRPASPHPSPSPTRQTPPPERPHAADVPAPATEQAAEPGDKQAAGKRSPLSRLSWAHSKPKASDDIPGPEQAKSEQPGGSDMSKGIAARIRRLRAAGVQG